MTVTEAVLAAAVAARDVSRRFGRGDCAVEALRGVSLSVPSGQFAAILGPSGPGLAGLDHPTTGSVEIGGQEITSMGDKDSRSCAAATSACRVVAAVAGMLASIGPARRAARLDPPAALQYE